MSKRVVEWAGRFWRWVKPLLVAGVVVLGLRSAVADWNDVPTGSMKPSIVEGDRIFVNKCAYDLKVPFTGWRIAEWSEPERFDVVVCFSPENGVRLVKRIVGLPGDTVELRNNVLYVNGRAAEYEPVLGGLGTSGDVRRPIVAMLESIGGHSHPVLFNPTMAAMRTFGPVKLADDEYFVMGDNRDDSRDGRYFGAVPRRSIAGRTSAVVFSLDLDHAGRPRPGRFLQEIP